MATLEVVYLPSNPLASKKDSVTIGQTDGSGNLMVALGAYNPNPGVPAALAANSASAMGVQFPAIQSPSIYDKLDKLSFQLSYLIEINLEVLSALNPGSLIADRTKDTLI